MTLMIVRYVADEGALCWGKLAGEAPNDPKQSLQVVKLDAAASTTGDLIDALDRNLIELEGEVTQISADRLRSPVTADGTLVCQGLNYSDHVSEAGHAERKANLLFVKASSSLSAPYGPIVRPAEVELLDFEVEVGIVLRAPPVRGVKIDDSNLADFVAGFVLCNDVSARDVMFGAGFMQWFQGKSYRTFCPAGPVLYLPARDALAKTVASLEISLAFNGEVRQSASTSQLIYKPAETLVQIASIMDLKRGDMVLTGTPGGVLVHVTPGVASALRDNLFDDVARRERFSEELKASSPFLQPGDVLTLTMRDARLGIELGAQETVISAA